MRAASGGLVGREERNTVVFRRETTRIEESGEPNVRSIPPKEMTREEWLIRASEGTLNHPERSSREEEEAPGRTTAEEAGGGANGAVGGAEAAEVGAVSTAGAEIAVGMEEPTKEGGTGGAGTPTKEGGSPTRTGASSGGGA